MKKDDIMLKTHKKYGKMREPLHETANTGLKKGTATFVLRRLVFGSTFTGGELLDPQGRRIAYTLEDADRGLTTSTSVSKTKATKASHPKKTAINAGTWDVDFRRNYSISSINTIDGGLGKGVVPVMNGYGWGGIRFHGGGSSGASAGCVILGTSLPTRDRITGWRDVVSRVNKEMIKYHLNGYKVQVRIERDKNAKLSAATDSFTSSSSNNTVASTTPTTTTQSEMSPLMILFKLIEAVLSMA